jgi:ABC-type multidrug transport system fused ATPase/permease subunit
VVRIHSIPSELSQVLCYCIQQIGLRAARKLYSQLLSSILAAGVAFFDQNPVGRILNRFSSDMYA